MNLEYKVLWFENDDEWYEVMEALLREEIEELGFVFSTLRATNGENLDELLTDPDIDLILMDFSLDNDYGDALMQRIRDQGVFTEMVFYSAVPHVELGQRVLENGVDGVYLAHRDDFEDRVISVVRTTTRKVLDISTMRGLVMAEVSDQEGMIADIIELYHEKDNQKGQAGVRAEICRRIGKSLSDRQRQLKRLMEQDDIRAILDCRDFDMDKKARTLAAIVEALSEGVCPPECADLVGAYRGDVLLRRNELAHVREVKDETGQKLLQGNGDFVFDDQACSEIRRSLKAHSENLRTLLDIVNGLAPTIN